MVESARSAQRLVLIDGCSVACALKTVKAVGLEPSDYLDVTQQGIEKNHDMNLHADHVDAIVDRVRSLLAEPPLHT
jgi:uncharacterized metal-binding protein